jgi:phage terminase Nu1 subunit (DNA packaging protein)
MTQAAFARLIGVSSERVRQYREQGYFSLEADGKIDVDKALVALGQNLDLDRASPDAGIFGASDGPKSYDDLEDDEISRQRVLADLRYKAGRAWREQMKAKHEAGQLVEREEAERVLFEAGRITRQNLSGIPDRLSAQLAGMTDASEIHALLKSEIDEAQEAIADDIEFGDAGQSSAA